MDRRRILVIAAALTATLGTVLVFLYARGADSRAQRQYDTVEVLVATAEIPRGESIQAAATAGKLARRAVPQGSVLADAETSTDGIESLVALTTIYPGEQIVPQKLGDTAAEDSPLVIPEKAIAMSVQLTDPARVAGFVGIGSDVAVFVNGTDPTSGAAFSRLLLPRVTVLAVGSTAPTPVAGDAAAAGGEQPAVAETLPNTLLTLALTQRQAEQVLVGQTVGELSVALLTDSSAVSAKGGGVDYTDLFGTK